MLVVALVAVVRFIIIIISSSSVRPILHLRGKESSLLLVTILIYFHVICPLYDDGGKYSTLNNISFFD
jgi:hypothetical protein